MADALQNFLDSTRSFAAEWREDYDLESMLAADEAAVRERLHELLMQGDDPRAPRALLALGIGNLKGSLELVALTAHPDTVRAEAWNALFLAGDRATAIPALLTILASSPSRVARNIAVCCLAELCLEPDIGAALMAATEDSDHVVRLNAAEAWVAARLGGGESPPGWRAQLLISRVAAPLPSIRAAARDAVLSLSLAAPGSALRQRLDEELLGLSPMAERWLDSWQHHTDLPANFRAEMTELERDWTDHMILMAAASADPRALPFLHELGLSALQVSEIAAQGDADWRARVEQSTFGENLSPPVPIGDSDADWTL